MDKIQILHIDEKDFDGTSTVMAMVNEINVMVKSSDIETALGRLVVLEKITSRFISDQRKSSPEVNTLTNVPSGFMK